MGHNLLPAHTFNLGLNEHYGRPLIRRGDDRCDFPHLLIDYLAFENERSSLLQCLKTNSINGLSVDLLKSNNVDIIRVLINFMLGTGLCI